MTSYCVYCNKRLDKTKKPVRFLQHDKCYNQKLTTMCRMCYLNYLKTLKPKPIKDDELL
jgi:hypothetical protein